jgi:hypothetical protein
MKAAAAKHDSLERPHTGSAGWQALKFSVFGAKSLWRRFGLMGCSYF